MIFPWNLGGAAQIVYGPGKSIVTVRITFSSGFHLLSPRHPYEDLRVLIFVAPQDEDFRFHFPRQHPEWLGISFSVRNTWRRLFVRSPHLSIRTQTYKQRHYGDSIFEYYMALKTK